MCPFESKLKSLKKINNINDNYKIGNSLNKDGSKKLAIHKQTCVQCVIETV